MDERDTTAVIDRALANGAGTATDPLERELEELTLALAANAPAANPVFAAELEQRVRQGFPRPEGRRGTARLPRLLRTAWAARPTLVRRRPSLAVLGGAASLLVALAIAFALTGDGTRVDPLSGGDSPGGASSAPEIQDLAQDGATSSEAPGSAGNSTLAAPDSGGSEASSKSRAYALPVPRGGFAPGKRDRRIERSASLALAAPGDRLDRVAADISAVTERHGGFVLRSSLTTGDEGLTSGGDFDLRIPAAKLQRALNDLADLGQVRSRTQTGDDVTVAFVTAGDRLESARAERTGLLERLESAETDLEAESLRLQLDANAARINRLRGQLRNLRVKTDYATVSVTLESREDSGSAAPGDGLGGAAEDALDSLGDSLEFAIRALGVAIPLALLAAALAVAARIVRRRRREAALS
jgi:hypothetical protein